MRLRPLIFAALLAGACDSSTVPEDHLELHVAVDPAVVSAATPATVTVTVVNVSDRSVTVPLRDCPQQFEVLSLEDDVVGREPVGCRLEGRLPVTLAPDEEWRATFEWRGSGFGGDPSQLNFVRLPAGPYKVRAALNPRCTNCVRKQSNAVPVVVQ